MRRKNALRPHASRRSIPGWPRAAGRTAKSNQAQPEVPDLSKPRAGYAEPVPVRHPEPPYSEKAQELCGAGTTVLSVVVGATGTVESARVVKPLGLGLDEEALRTVRTWTFKPAMHGRRPVLARVLIEVSFGLR